MKKAARRTLGLGVMAGAVYGVWRAYQRRMPAPDPDASWQPAPFPFPPIPRPSSTPRREAANGAAVAAVAAVDPVDGECPASHPVKGKLGSGIYHVAGGLNYTRTRPDRCYVDAAAAEADGLRPAKR